MNFNFLLDNCSAKWAFFEVDLADIAAAEMAAGKEDDVTLPIQADDTLGRDEGLHGRSRGAASAFFKVSAGFFMFGCGGETFIQIDDRSGRLVQSWVLSG